MQVGVRQTLMVIVLATVMLVLILYGAFMEQSVYACHDKETNPPEIQQLCKRLTKGQWWHK